MFLFPTKETQKFLVYLRAEKNYSPHTIESYTNDLGDFYAFLDKEPLESVTKDSARRFLASLGEKELSKRTMARRMATLRTFLPHSCVLGNRRRYSGLSMMRCTSRFMRLARSAP